MPSLLLLHLLVVLGFLLFFAAKTGLLLTNRLDQLRQLRARTRVVDSVLGLLILLTGGALLWRYPGNTPGWLWLKLGLVVVLLPLAIAAMRRQHKVGVVLTLLGFIYVYGLAETGSLILQPDGPAAARPNYATTPGLAEAAATPEAAVPVDTVVAASTLLAAAEATEAPVTPEAAPIAETGQVDAGQTLFAQNCAVCHGTDGKLGLNGAHDLTKSNLNAAGRTYMVSNGLGKMPSFQGKLTEEQIQQVVAYSLTLR